MKKIPLFGLIAAVALLVISIGNGLAANPVRSHQYDVLEHGLCLFGHWISGTVEVVLSDEDILINRIRVAPPIATEARKQEIAGPSTDKGRLTQGLYRLQESLAAEKVSSERITSKSLKYLEDSPLVDRVEQLQGVVYRIYWAEGGSTMVNIGVPPGSDQEKGEPENRTGEFYDKLCGWLSKNKVVIIASCGLVVLPERMRTDPAFLAEVNRAQGGVGKWDVETWVGAKFFPSTIAEEMRVSQDPSTQLGAE